MLGGDKLSEFAAWCVNMNTGGLPPPLKPDKTSRRERELFWKTTIHSGGQSSPVRPWNRKTEAATLEPQNIILKPMKPVKPLATLFLAVLAVTALFAGCASKPNLLDQENAAMGAGFKIITPKTPGQLARLQKLPPNKVTQITFGGKPYYILPDLAGHRAFIGGPKQYQAYRQFRHEQVVNAENYQSPPPNIQVVEVNDTDWGGWDGWGPVGPDGLLGEPGWY
jgi:hypothetical protein